MKIIHKTRLFHFCRWAYWFSCRVWKETRRTSDHFGPYIPPSPTVRCQCGWSGVGVQARMGRDDGKPWCPDCHSTKKLKWVGKVPTYIDDKGTLRSSISDKVVTETVY